MNFENGHIYHIYNQGNNRQKIFFNHGNYLYFLKKVGTYILPYGDIIAWCLMPNHFHLMVLVNRLLTYSESDSKSGSGLLNTEGSAQSETLGIKTRSINQSIGIMLRSYTNAINKQENRTGALFRKQTKAECITFPNGLSPAFYNSASGTLISTNNPEQEYPQICFNYIHQNPVKAGLVKKAEDWEFSSYRDYMGFRHGKLINKQIADEYVDW